MLHPPGGHLRSRASGTLDAADLVVPPLAPDECQVALPRDGHRVLGMARDGEMAFTMPASRAAPVLAGFQTTHAMGQRDPVLLVLRVPPDMPEADQHRLAQVRSAAGRGGREPDAPWAPSPEPARRVSRTRQETGPVGS